MGLSLLEVEWIQTYFLNTFLNTFFICTTGSLFPSTVHRDFDWAGPARLVDPLVMTDNVAFTKYRSQCLKLPPPIYFNVVFNSALHHSTFPGAGV